MTKETLYQPSKKILEKYAKVMVDFALGNGHGITPGDTVYLVAPESAKPLFTACRTLITKRGGNTIISYLPDEQDSRTKETPDFFTYANPAQLDYTPTAVVDGLVKETDHILGIVAPANLHAMKSVDPTKMMRKQATNKHMMEKRQMKELAGKLSWTVCLYPTQALADEAGMTLKQYWNEVVRACLLKEKNPIKAWKDLYKKIDKHKKNLDKITTQTAQFHIQGEDVDLWITPGVGRQWVRSTGQNIPSFELFTSPDWRGTEGWIRFNQPLYFNGVIITEAQLWFEDGVVVKSTARKNRTVLQEMIAVENADKVGEFSLTDKRYSKITKFMAETLYDENVGGPFGNTHIALGASYIDTYVGEKSLKTKKQFESVGYNFSAVHTDIMSTTDRTVTAYLHDGTAKVIYKDGMYQV